MGLTDKEAKLLLLLFEAKATEAGRHAQHWEDTSDEGYPDGPEALAHEKSFSKGFQLGAQSMLYIAKDVLEDNA